MSWLPNQQSRLPTPLGAPALAMFTGQTVVREVADRPNIWEVIDVATYFYDVGIQSVYAPQTVKALQLRAGTDGIDAEEAAYIVSTYPDITKIHFFGGEIEWRLLNTIMLDMRNVRTYTSDAPFDGMCVIHMAFDGLRVASVESLEALITLTTDATTRNLRSDDLRVLQTAGIEAVALYQNVPLDAQLLNHLPDLKCVRLGHGFPHGRRVRDLNSSRIHDMKLFDILAGLPLQCLKIHSSLNPWTVRALSRFTNLVELHIEFSGDEYLDEVVDVVKPLSNLRTLGLWFDLIGEPHGDTMDVLAKFQFPQITELIIGAPPDCPVFNARVHFPGALKATVYLCQYDEEDCEFDCSFFADCCPNLVTLKLVDWAEDEQRTTVLYNERMLNSIPSLRNVEFNVQPHSVQESLVHAVSVEVLPVQAYQKDHPVRHSI